MDATETPRTDAVWRNKSFGFYEMRDIANTLERELAAMTARADIGTVTVSIIAPVKDNPFLRLHCKIVDVGHADRCLVVECPELQSAIEAMTAAKGLAERQVAVLCKQIGETGWCPTEQTCQSGKTGCSGCWAAWSRAEAEKGFAP
jgi:hypothetical protein